MACCLMAPSHYLNQCWFIFSKVWQHSSEGNFTIDTSPIYHKNCLKNYLSEISFKSPRGQWVEGCLLAPLLPFTSYTLGKQEHYHIIHGLSYNTFLYIKHWKIYHYLCIHTITHICKYIFIQLYILSSQYIQATGLDAWASRVKCPARFVSHLHDICIYMNCL